jgi:hypothetical protein
MDPIDGTVIQSFLPSSIIPPVSPRGLAFDGQNLYVIDDFRDRTYQLTVQGVDITRRTAPGPTCVGLMFAHSTLYALDTTDNLIYQLSLN